MMNGAAPCGAWLSLIYDIFNVRSLHYEERWRLFKTAVRKYRPALVVLDGVRDFLERGTTLRATAPPLRPPCKGAIGGG